MAVPPAASGESGHLRSVTAYVGAGAIATACHYAITVAAVEKLDTNPLHATMAGFAIGAIVKYFLNYFVAFRSTERHSSALVKFAMSLALLFALNALSFALLHEYFGLHYLLAQVLTTGLLIPSGYLVSRLWVFRTSSAST